MEQRFTWARGTQGLGSKHNDRKLIEAREKSVPMSIFVVFYWKS